MNSNLVLRTAFVASLLFATSAARGQMYVWLVVDPPTTAGAGIPDAGGFSVASSKSGPGSFHIYAVDDIAGSYGISGFRIKLNPSGTFTSLINRSPQTGWDDALDDPYDAGFWLAHSPGGINPVEGYQATVGKPLISGFGQAASNFAAKIPDAVDYFTLSNITPGQWGNYADPNTKGVVLASGNFRNALFIAEGTYTGSTPSIQFSTPIASGGTVVFHWTSDPAANPTASPESALSISSSNPFVPEPSTIALISGVGAFIGGARLRRRQ